MIALDKPLSIHTRLNCGCGWHPTATHGGTTAHGVVEVATSHLSQAATHVEETGHTVEMFAEVRALFTPAPAEAI